jgi:hypothetical protein
MKKTNKIVLVVVLILVVAFGVGQFFAGSGPIAANPNATSTATNSGSPSTQVVYYAPPALATSTPVLKGSCWTNSIAAPYRPDAWRCTVGNGIQDPCFQIGASTSSLLCGVNPANPDSSSTFALELTSPLPTPETIPTSTGASTAWLIELQGGTLCSPFTGTLPPVMDGGQTANYDCAPGPLGKETVIFGSLNSVSNLWTADVGELSTSTKIFPPAIVASSSVPVAEVWE